MRRSYRARQAEIAAALPKYMSVATAAELLGCTPATVRRRIRAKRLPGHPSFPGGPFIIPVVEFTEHLRGLADSDG